MAEDRPFLARIFDDLEVVGGVLRVVVRVPGKTVSKRVRLQYRQLQLQ